MTARSQQACFSAAVIIAVLAAVLAVLLPATAASAQTGPAAGTRVGAHHSGMILTVGPSAIVSAGEGRCEPVPQASVVAGLCVAAEDNTSLTCGGQSFTPDTKVLTATGTLVPISKLRKGDKVKATDTNTGKTTAGTVAAVLVHHDTDKYDLTVRTGGTMAVIQTTSSHLFFDQDTGRWVKAGTLKYGTHLRTSSGGTATVTGGWTPADAAGWMWDLTIPGDHDFYIQAAESAVLVHNCGETPETFENQLPGTLDSERATAEELGVRASEPGTAPFDEAVRGGRVKFAVNTAGELRSVPEFVQGQEISHAVIFSGVNPPGESGDSICWESVRHGTSCEELPA